MTQNESDSKRTAIRVYFLPPAPSGDQASDILSGSTAVVIDLLRATTTICHALAAGATEVVACQTVDDAHAAVASLSRIGEQRSCVLGGERGGVKIASFDLGNSPGEYTAETVAGKRVVFTTTNGTRAIAACRGAQRIVLASLANLSAVCRAIAAAETIDIVCAGTDGHITAEDVLTAGAIVDRLTRAHLSHQPCWLNDEAQLAQAAWQAINNAQQSDKALLNALYMSRGGANLLALSYGRDIELAAHVDSLAVMPEVTSSIDPRWAIIRSAS